MATASGDPPESGLMTRAFVLALLAGAVGMRFGAEIVAVVVLWLVGGRS